jgi:hypothetical protein
MNLKKGWEIHSSTFYILNEKQHINTTIFIKAIINNGTEIISFLPTEEKTKVVCAELLMEIKVISTFLIRLDIFIIVRNCSPR